MAKRSQQARATEVSLRRRPEPLHELRKARLRLCPVFALLCLVISEAPRPPNAGEAAPVSCFHPVGYAETANARLWPLFLFFRVFYRDRHLQISECRVGNGVFAVAHASTEQLCHVQQRSREQRRATPWVSRNIRAPRRCPPYRVSLRPRQQESHGEDNT